MIGTTISHYKITDKLGQGGMGVVYKATDTKLERTVALKFLARHLLEDDVHKARFVQEAKAAAALDHPNICTIHEIDEAEGQAFLAMAFLDGSTVSEKIKERPLKLDEALDIALQAGEGLRAAHEKGIVHRDVKSSNLMLTKDGRVQIMDFGLAYLADRTRLTKSETMLGTPAYMSPEQVQREPLDRRTDIWSLGVVIYEMVSGLLPFEGEREQAVFYAITDEEPEPITALRARVPLELDRIVGKAMAKSADERYPHIDDMLVDLRALRKELPSTRATPVGTQRVAPAAAAGKAPSPAAASVEMEAPVPLKRRLWREPIVLGAVLLVLAVVILALSLRSPETLQPARAVGRFAVNLPPGQTFGPAATVVLSPDGKQIAYIAVTEGGGPAGRKLYLRSMDKLQSEALAGTEGAAWPAFSPDGKWVAFAANTGTGDADVKKVSLLGGSPQTLCDFGRIGKGWYMGTSWGPNDTILFGSDVGLIRVSAAGGTPEAVATVDQKNGEFYHGWPDILPGGKAALFSIGQRPGQGMGQLSSIAGVSLETGEQRTLIKDGTRPYYVPTGHLVYAQAGKLMAAPFDLDELKLTGAPAVIAEGIRTGILGAALFSVSDSGSLAYVSGVYDLERSPNNSTLVWADRKGQEEPLDAEPRHYDSFRPRLSPDGRRLAVSRFFSINRDVWIYDLARETSTRLTFDAARDTDLVWTPDGRRVLFGSERHGVANLFWKAADGTGQVERLTTSPNRQAPSSFSPDGKSLAFTERNPKTGTDIHVLSMEGERTSRPLLETPFDEHRPVISPDGRRLAYESNESGRQEVHVRPFPNVEEGKWQISRDGGRQPVWGPRGRELFYRTGQTMMVVSIETEPTFTPGRPEVLFTGSSFRNYDIAPDGRRFVLLKPIDYAEDKSRPEQFIVVENWFEELKRLAPVGH